MILAEIGIDALQFVATAVITFVLLLIYARIRSLSKKNDHG